MGLTRLRVSYNETMTGKQAQILRTDELDIRLASDGKKHMMPNAISAESDAPFQLTVNNLTVDISLADLLYLCKSIDLYLKRLGYTHDDLSILYRYAIQPRLDTIR